MPSVRLVDLSNRDTCCLREGIPVAVFLVHLLLLWEADTQVDYGVQEMIHHGCSFGLVQFPQYRGSAALPLQVLLGC